jgi:hypothetical protein
MSSKNHEENGYDHNVDLLETKCIIYVFHILREVGAELRVSHYRVRETFELNQLKSAPSQLLPVFSGFDQL